MPGTPLPMRPEGITGRLFGWLMERLNADVYALALDLLAPEDGEAIVEIGFGTGRLVEILAGRMPRGRIAGVDPAATMLAVARARPGVREAVARVDLRLGRAEELPWRDASFDGALALHCFQFWPEPEAGAREVLRVLEPGGRLVLVLREHPRGRAPAWLPNPISRGDDELEGARRCLRAAGFAVGDDLPGRQALCAVKPGARARGAESRP